MSSHPILSITCTMTLLTPFNWYGKLNETSLDITSSNTL
jgi:hypothetical protein